MTSIFIILVGLALALAVEQPPDTLVDSIVIETPYEFDFNKWAINRSLEDSLIKINRLLFNRLPKNKDPVEHIKVAKEILKESSGSLHHVGSTYEQVFRKALKTFIALERTEGQCTWRSYLILAENFVATEGHLNRAMARVYSVMDYYFKRHAKKCRPYYKDKFKELKTTMDGGDLRKIQVSFSKFTDLNDLSIIANNAFELTERILGSIVDRIAFMMRENYEWHQTFGTDANGVSNNSFAQTATMVRKYILTPCQNYRNHFKSILVPARLDAAVEDEDQWSYLTSDEDFATGLRNYIICNSLIRNGSKNQYLTVMQYAFDKLIGVR